MLDALFITQTLGVCIFWKVIVTPRLERTDAWKNSPPWVKLLSQYYTITFIAFGRLVFDGAASTFMALFSFGFANPTKFLVHEENIAHFNSTLTGHMLATCEKFPITPLHWSANHTAEVRFDEHGVMRVLVLGSCPAVVLTQLIGWIHIGRHLMKIKNSETVTLEENYMRDKAIQIMFLPIIYSIVTYKNVIRLMNLFTGVIDVCMDEWGLDFKEKKSYTLSLYEANLAMADFYEVVALLHFTSLTLEHVKNTFRREHDENITLAMRVNDVMAGLVQSGVLSFCATCLLSFLRGLYFVYCIVHNQQAVDPDEGSMSATLSGAGLVASCVAIQNVINVEMAFHDELHHFKPGAKFWSTKVIVSICFIQEFLLGLLGKPSLMNTLGFDPLSELQIKLLYVSLLTYEVMGVALLHVYAWPADARITPLERGVSKDSVKRDEEKDKYGLEYWTEGDAGGHGHGSHVQAREPLLAVE